MADDVTRAEIDDLQSRVAALEGKKPPVSTTGGGTIPVPPPTATSPVPLAAPKVVVDGSSFTASVTGVFSTPLTLRYFQIAVRGPGAQDVALSPSTSGTAGQAVTIKGTGRLPAGTFTAYGAYSIDGTTWVDGPKTTFTITESTFTAAATTTTPVPTGTRKVPLVGRSGLRFNSIVFRQTPAAAEEFGRKRGTPVDGFLLFQPRRNWGDLRWGVDRGYREWLESGRLIVLSIPHAPEAEGDAMNSRGANDAYKAQQRDLGAFYKDSGLNSANCVVRVDWECNGSWYNWSANRPGGHQALRQSLIHAVDNLRAGGMTKPRYDLCYNKGPSQAGHDFDIYPGPEWFEIIGIDQYDMWAPSFNDADWEREMNKPPSMRSVAALARKHGVSWAVDECGNTHGGNVQGGDNPFFWTAMVKEIERNLDNNAYHTTYDDAGAPNTLRHDFASNPKSFETYKRLFTPR